MVVSLITTILIYTSPVDAAIDNLDIGGDILTQYFFGKDFDLSSSLPDETDFFRLEAHLWFQADLDDNITTRLSFEIDRALESINIGNVNNLRSSGVGSLELFLEEAYIDVARIAGSGFSFSVGRQFLNYGDNPLAEDFNQWWGHGFIIADSNTNSPLLLTQLGSYEIDPFDAVVLTHETENTSLDLIHARDTEDSVLGVNGTDADAYMWGIYGSYYGIQNHQIDFYTTYNDQNGPTGSIGFDGDRWIIGGRIAGDINQSLAYKAEIAYQFDDNNRGGNDANALATQVGVNYHPDLKYNPNIGFIYTFLEQDGPPGTMSGFAAPFEGKTYGLIAEGLIKTLNGLNPFTNMHVFNVNGGLQPWRNINMRFDMHYLLLHEELMLNTDKDAGFEFDTQMDYRFNDYLTTFFGGGVFIPGDAVEATLGDNDRAYFIRAGMKVHF